MNGYSTENRNTSCNDIILLANKYRYILPKYWNTGEKIVPNSVVLGGLADSGHSSMGGVLATFTRVVPDVAELNDIRMNTQLMMAHIYVTNITMLFLSP